MSHAWTEGSGGMRRRHLEAGCSEMLPSAKQVQSDRLPEPVLESMIILSSSTCVARVCLKRPTLPRKAEDQIQRQVIRAVLTLSKSSY